MRTGLNDTLNKLFAAGSNLQEAEIEKVRFNRT